MYYVGINFHAPNFHAIRYHHYSPLSRFVILRFGVDILSKALTFSFKDLFRGRHLINKLSGDFDDYMVQSCFYATFLMTYKLDLPIAPFTSTYTTNSSSVDNWFFWKSISSTLSSTYFRQTGSIKVAIDRKTPW